MLTDDTIEPNNAIGLPFSQLMILVETVEA
jgi:hypothetical protein